MALNAEKRAELGHYLTSLRDAVGISQEVAGERVGVSRVQIARWEGGKSVPDWDKLADIANAYQSSLQELRARYGLDTQTDLSAWALSLAHRIERRTNNLSKEQRIRVEKTIDSVLNLTAA